jgi:hypothetical protein
MLLYRCNSGYSTAPECYVIRTELKMAIHEVTTGIQRVYRIYVSQQIFDRWLNYNILNYKRYTSPDEF